MSNPIDDSIRELLDDLGPGWHLDDVRTSWVNSQTMGGVAEDLPGACIVRIRHTQRGLLATGEGGSFGSALAMAAKQVLDQGTRVLGVRAKERA